MKKQRKNKCIAHECYVHNDLSVKCDDSHEHGLEGVRGAPDNDGDRLRFRLTDPFFPSCCFFPSGKILSSFSRASMSASSLILLSLGVSVLPWLESSGSGRSLHASSCLSRRPLLTSSQLSWTLPRSSLGLLLRLMSSADPLVVSFVSCKVRISNITRLSRLFYDAAFHKMHHGK